MLESRIMKKLLAAVILTLMFLPQLQASTLRGGYGDGFLNYYLNNEEEFKVLAVITTGPHKGAFVMSGKNKTKEQAIETINNTSWMIKGSQDIWCKYGCEILYINNKENQTKEIAISKGSNQINQKKQDAIMFTIKDKREQCEAIGFKPKTEKFADCVLRLVELDIKKQQDNKIATAQNSGNMQIANQLLQMRNDNNAQYLIDLGQQLLTPQSFNSNIYLPQTQNCTIMGFDSFAKMTCN